MISNELSKMRQEISNLKEMVSNLADNDTKKQKNTFAEVVSRPAVIITPRNYQNSTKTKEDIKEKIQPAKLKVGVSAVNNLKNGGIAVQCPRREDADRLKIEVEEELGDNYEIRFKNVKS